MKICLPVVAFFASAASIIGVLASPVVNSGLDNLEKRATLTIDDAQTSQILYSPSGWTHLTNQDPSKLNAGTESYSHNAEASYSFYCNGHSKIAIWGGKKSDRGVFNVMFSATNGNSYYLGQGDAYSTASCSGGVCAAVNTFSFDLAAHSYPTNGVIIVNNAHDSRVPNGVPFLEVDKIVLS